MTKTTSVKSPATAESAAYETLIVELRNEGIVGDRFWGRGEDGYWYDLSPFNYDMIWEDVESPEFDVYVMFYNGQVYLREELNQNGTSRWGW